MNCVRVYNRDDCGDSIQVEWFDDLGRHQKALSTIVGVPVTDRTFARDIADTMSAAQAEKRTQHAREMLYGNGGITLGMLLDRLHESREPKWSPGFVRDQQRYKKFWLAELGADTPVHPSHINEDRVARIVDAAALVAKRKWTEATKKHYLRYIKDALTFGHEQLKVLDVRVLLTALEMPGNLGRGVAYTSGEVAQLLRDLFERDLRAYVVAAAYHQQGRRLNATRLLTVDQVRFVTFPTPRGKRVGAVLAYPAETDKADTAGEAVLSDAGGVRAVTAVRTLLATPAVKATGLLMPVGDLTLDSRIVGRRRAKRGPIRKETLGDILMDAETACGIEHVTGRGYHAFKRRFATMSKEERAIASAASGTSEATLADVYEQDDDLQGKFELGIGLAEALPAPPKLRVVRGGKR